MAEHRRQDIKHVFTRQNSSKRRTWDPVQLQVELVEGTTLTFRKQLSWYNVAKNSSLTSNNNNSETKTESRMDESTGDQREEMEHR